MRMPKDSKTPEASSRLSPEQYRLTQQNGTEHPRTAEYLDNKGTGDPRRKIDAAIAACG
jgi:peptide-methionine (R)-S-oxide reductase